MEPAILLAHNGGPPENWFARPASLYIALSAAQSPGISLLGRDFIAATRLFMDMSNNVVTLDPLP
ncbi:MAG TPA: hypothetical protein VIK11_08150 [Tepidiformaceae bacterium]